MLGDDVVIYHFYAIYRYNLPLISAYDDKKYLFLPCFRNDAYGGKTQLFRHEREIFTLLV
ncbi:MAG: hypothetical protein Q4A06_00865 [Cardiobacteriaceae bacterium]|nr:hypothetical protein [Cardiobacteriaceae bacterium]